MSTLRDKIVARLSSLFHSDRPLAIQFLKWGFFLALIRDFSLIYAPRFWAEEGQVFYSYAVSHSFWETLSLIQFGYFNISNNLPAYLATLLPLKWAPFVPMIFSLGILLFGAWIIGNLKHPFLNEKAKWILFLLYFVVMPSNEVWMNTINLQSYYCAILFLIGLSEAPAKRFQRNAFRLYVVFAALSGPNAALAMPAFAIKAYKEKSKERWIQTILLLGAVSLHGMTFVLSYLQGVSTVTDRFDLGSSLKSFFPMLLVKSFILSIFGNKMANIAGSEIVQGLQSQGAWLVVGVTAAIVIALMWKIYRNLPKSDKIFAFLYLMILYFSVGFLSRGDKFRYINAFGGGRYFYSINFVLLSTVTVLSFYVRDYWSKYARWALYVAIFWGGLTYRRFTPDGPPWRKEVEIYEQQGSSYKLRIWPEGIWHVDLSGGPIQTEVVKPGP